MKPICMNHNKVINVFGLLAVLLLALMFSGCQPRVVAEPTPDANLIGTSAAQTVVAAITSTALAQPTATLEPTATETPQPTATSQPTLTPTQGATHTPTATATVLYVVYNTPTPSVGVVVSSTSLAAAESFSVSVIGFPKNADIDIYLSKEGAAPSVTLDSNTDSSGAANATLSIPVSAVKDEKWVVRVTTTELSPNVSATSAVITIVVKESTSTPTGVTVTLSSTSVKAGSSFTVYVSGFPKNANIDYHLGKEGAAYSVAVDGATNASGAASTSMTMPASAVKGEKWVVTVLTTDLVSGVTKTSSAITITD